MDSVRVISGEKSWREWNSLALCLKRGRGGGGGADLCSNVSPEMRHALTRLMYDWVVSSPNAP